MSGRKRALVRHTTAALTALVLYLASPSLAAQGQGGLPLPDDPLGGRLLFESKGCIQCHAIAGSGASIGPSLGEGRFGGSFLELGASLWNHVPGMSVTSEVTGLAWPELTESEMVRLMAFLYFIDYLGSPGDPGAGQRVFEDQGCAFCHDLVGGETGVGPNLSNLQRFASPLYVAQEIWNHGPQMLRSMRELGMPAPTFTAGDLADLSAFLRQQADDRPQERLLLAPGDPNSGHEVFGRKGCSHCHGTGARGGEEGPDLRHSDLHRSAESIAGTMWNHAFVMSDSMRQRGVDWPHFEESELADLIAFLYFLPFADSPGSAERGAEVFRSRSCADCHAEGELSPGEPTGLAPELSGSGAATSAPALVAAMWNHAPIMKKTILGEGLPWPELTGPDLRDLRAFLERQVPAP